MLLFESVPELVKPALKWAGGKRWLVPHLLPHWRRESKRRLVEPFCGGLAVTLGLQPEGALLNDLNPHLIHFYRRLKAGLRIELPMSNEEALFYQHRARFNELLRQGMAETEEAAGLFYYLNRTGFNGLCRFNRKGEFNVPFGRYTSITYVRDFTAYQAAFQNWDFVSKSFHELEVGSEDFIYADPPYDVEFTQYSKEAFKWDEQVRTAQWLARHPGPVVLSNQATDRIVALYEQCGFKLRLLDAPRRINCTGDRSPAREVLAFRNLG
ncbi:MAG TPA: Dam family site-specific DNA-(adenine-N6)-methyltransferase [Verrucomicrobiae bacterium]|nr:Dam family site-specific DNA-(adenine-N6)-methyltransferase [Verrucomicrobiae bacterium]